MRLLWIAPVLLLAAGCAGGTLVPGTPGATGISVSSPAKPQPTNAPISFGSPSSTNGATGTCAPPGIAFTASGQTATVPILQPGYTGTYTTTSSSGSATSSIAGSVVTITAVAAGPATITVSDNKGDTASCVVSVTISSGVAE